MPKTPGQRSAAGALATLVTIVGVVSISRHPTIAQAAGDEARKGTAPAEAGAPPTVQVIGSVFRKETGEGNFGKMINQPENQDALFVFNDNEEQFQAHLHDPRDPLGCSVGAGNADLRPYQCRQPPRAAGIPTGSNGKGYSSLTPPVRQQIDQSLDAIRKVLVANNYKRVFYSAKDASGDLGTGTFEVDPEVRGYIVQGLRRLGSR